MGVGNGHSHHGHMSAVDAAVGGVFVVVVDLSERDQTNRANGGTVALVDDVQMDALSDDHHY